MTMPVADLGTHDVVPAGEKRVHLVGRELRRTMHNRTFHGITAAARSRARAAKREQKKQGVGSSLALEVGLDREKDIPSRSRVRKTRGQALNATPDVRNDGALSAGS
jgi:hypothetical protein